MKQIPEYEGIYWASPDGYVCNGRKIMKTYTINSGYQCLKLHNACGRKSVLLHRLIAEVFIPNPENKPEVNHIDGNKGNNAVSNLEWVTSSENKLHALRTGIKEYNDPTLGLKIGSGSKYRNVSYDKARNKWSACIRVNGKNYYQKRFNTEEEAALHVNWIIDTMGLHDRPKNVI